MSKNNIKSGDKILINCGIYNCQTIEQSKQTNGKHSNAMYEFVSPIDLHLIGTANNNERKIKRRQWQIVSWIILIAEWLIIVRIDQSLFKYQNMVNYGH